MKEDPNFLKNKAIGCQLVKINVFDGLAVQMATMKINCVTTTTVTDTLPDLLQQLQSITKFVGDRMGKSDLWATCVDPFLAVGETENATKKTKLRASSAKWNKMCEAQKRVERAGIKSMVRWIQNNIKKISALCPTEMKTECSIIAAMTISVRLHPDFVKQLHARLAEGPGVLRTTVDNSDVPGKSTLSKGVERSHAQRHLLKMISIWRDDLDTMAFLDWRAAVLDVIYGNIDGISKVQQLNSYSALKHFEGYQKGYVELQISIFVHLPGLLTHLQALLSKLYEEHSQTPRVFDELPVEEDTQCGDVGKALLAEFNILKSHGYDYTVFQQMALHGAGNVLPSTPDEWAKIILSSSACVPQPVRTAWANLMIKVERISAEVVVQAAADAKAAEKKRQIAEATEKGHLCTEWEGGSEWVDCFWDITTDLTVDRTGNPWNTMNEHTLEAIIDTVVYNVMHNMRATISEIEELIDTNIHTHTAKADAKLALDARQKKDREALAKQLEDNLAKAKEKLAKEQEAKKGAVTASENSETAEPVAEAETADTAEPVSTLESLEETQAAERAAWEIQDFTDNDGIKMLDDDAREEPSSEDESETDREDEKEEIEETNADTPAKPTKTRHRRKPPQYGPEFCANDEQVNKRYKECVHYSAMDVLELFSPESDFRKKWHGKVTCVCTDLPYGIGLPNFIIDPLWRGRA